MATNRTTLRWMRGAAASALAALTLVVLAQTPAHADQEVAISFNPGSVQVNIGGGNAQATMTLQNQAASVSAIDVTVTGAPSNLNNQASVDMGGGQGCQGGGNTMQCRIEPGGTATIQLSIAPRTESNLPQGESLQGSFDVTASSRDGQGGGGNSGGSLPITVVGAANPDSVPSIAGTITGDKSKPLEGVKVEATDSDGAKFNATTGADGGYTITPTAGGTIAPGEITLKATKSGYETKNLTVNGIGGEAAKSSFTMVKKTDKPADSGSAAPPPAENATPADKDEGWGVGTWILAIVGVLFVVGGIVAIVLLLKRGKHDEEDDDLFSDKPPVHTPKAAQTGLPGVYDAGPRSPVMDAPTMIHNGPLLDDEDLARYGSGGPSAAPPTTAFGPAYGDRGEQPTQMFDPRGAGPVSGAPMSGGPVSGGPVSGGPVSGAPTQMFDPRGGAGYDDRDSYASPPPSRGGYDERDRGYGPPADRYGPPAQDQRGGYDQGGYGAPAPEPRGYDDRDRGYGPPSPPPPPPPMPPAPPPAPSRGGYDDRDRGYGPPAQDQRGGYDQGGYGAPAPEPRGYDDRYGPPAQDQRGYGPPPSQQQSYEQDPRYDRPQQGGGYGPPAQDQRGGYDERDRGYGPPPPPPESRDGYDDRGYDDRPRW